MLHWHAGVQQQHCHTLLLASEPTIPRASFLAAGCFIGTLMGTMTKMNPEAQKVLAPQPPGGATPEMAQRMQVSAAALLATQVAHPWLHSAWRATHAAVLSIIRFCAVISQVLHRGLLSTAGCVCQQMVPAVAARPADGACSCSSTGRWCLQLQRAFLTAWWC